MWSVALIIGVAVASSLATLAAGITLAISIERHNHRKILRAHGIEPSTTPIRSKERDSDAINKRASFRRSIRLSSNQIEGWAVLDNDSNSQIEATQSAEQTAQPDLSDQKPSSILVRQFSKKGSRHEKKLKKSMPLNPSMNSPLSVITEYTGSPQSLVLPVELPTESTPRCAAVEESWPLPVPWPITIAKTRNVDMSCPVHANNIPSALAQPRDTVLERPPSLHRSTSTTSTASNPPGDPLPPIPKIEVSNYNTSRFRHSSVGSVDTVDSSVLEHPAMASIKTSSQAFGDFDFGLNPVTMRFNSPARQTQQGFYDQRVAVKSFRASMNATFTGADTPLSRSTSHSLRQTFEPTTSHTNRTVTGSTSRHSMFANCNNIDKRSSLLPSPLDEVDDPFRSRIPRPISFGSGTEVTWNKGQRFPAQSEVLGRTNSQAKGHKRQNCVRISIPLVETKTQRQFQMPQVVEEPESDPIKLTQATTRSPVNSILWPPPLSLARPITILSVARPDSDVFSYGNPLTPQKDLNQWELEGTPASHMSSPARGYNTPTLSSPAYSPAHLFPRVSKVQGPRNNPNRNNQSRRKSGTSDLRRSVMMLHSLNTEGKILDDDKRSSHQSLSMTRHSIVLLNSSPKALSPNLRMLSPSPTTSRPSTPRKDMPYSQSTMSIWEDVSVRDDSPEPELPALTDSKLVNASPELRTPMKNVVDYEARENLVDKLQIGHQTLKDGDGKAMGLGLRMSSVMQTPRSLYDHEGFLKD